MKDPVVTTPPGLPTKVVLLLAAAVFINYVDRGNLATASPPLKDELGLSRHGKLTGSIVIRVMNT